MHSDGHSQMFTSSYDRMPIKLSAVPAPMRAGNSVSLTYPEVSMKSSRENADSNQRR